NANGKTRIEDHLRGCLDALDHLLRTGKLPWWGETLLSPTSSWFTALLQSRPGPLLETLRSAAVSPGAINRLIRYLLPTDLAGIVRLAAPEYGGLLILYIEVGAGLAKDNGLSSSQRSRTSGVHWREALRFVLDENPPGRIPAEALHALCRRVSQQLG